MQPILLTTHRMDRSRRDAILIVGTNTEVTVFDFALLDVPDFKTLGTVLVPPVTAAMRYHTRLTRESFTCCGLDSFADVKRVDLNGKEALNSGLRDRSEVTARILQRPPINLREVYARFIRP